MTTDPPGTRRTGGRLLAALWLLWGAGLAINGLLAWKTAGAGTDGSVSLPGCTAAGFDCDAVLTSPYSRVFGISLTYWAMGYYAGLLLLLSLHQWRRRIGTALLLPAAATPSLIAAVYLMGVMHRQLGAYCTWCLADHAVNVLFLIAAGLHARALWNQEQQRRRDANQPPLDGRLLHLTINAAIVLAAWAGTVLAFWHAPTTLTVAPAAQGKSPLAVLSFEANQTPLETVLGDPRSTKTVVLFSCPTCSHCRRVHGLLEQVLQDEAYRVEMRFAPLDPSCNPTWADEEHVSEAHRQACALTKIALAVAAADETAFAEFSAWLYGHQAGMTAERAEQEARRRVGADAFDNALAAAAVSERLTEDVRLAQSADVRSVPRLFVPAGPLDGVILHSNLAEALRRSFASQAVP